MPDDFALDIKLLMAECFDVYEFYVLSHSSGGFTGIELALALGGNCRGLFLTNPLPPNGWGHRYDGPIKKREDVEKYVPFTKFRFEMIQKLDFKMYQTFLQALGYKEKTKEDSYRNLLIFCS